VRGGINGQRRTMASNDGFSFVNVALDAQDKCPNPCLFAALPVGIVGLNISSSVRSLECSINRSRHVGTNPFS
jgi:hypothetical protein